MTPNEYAAQVLMDHQQDDGGCYCGREVRNTSHARHLVEELVAAGLCLAFDLTMGADDDQWRRGRHRQSQEADRGR